MTRGLKKELGDWGEKQAAAFLVRHGYYIEEQQYQIRGAEIDIIARNLHGQFGKTLCFIEVKTRTGFLGSAEQATSWQKILHIQKAARFYCIAHTVADDVPISFEQVSVYVSRTDKKVKFFHYILPVEK